MDKLIPQEIKKIELVRKTDLPWQQDQPWPQKYHTFADGKWTVLDTPGTTDASITDLVLYSWNIDFMLPFADARMLEATRCLQRLVAMQSPNTASVIFLQESLQSDIDLLAKEPWVRDNYQLSDVDISNWTSGRYGTITLVDKRLNIHDSFRVHYSKTVMERDAFFTDISLASFRIRLCNTHLESLAIDPPRRPAQVELCAEHMHKQGIHGTVMAGDFNAIQDFDRTLHSDHKLKDAYLELGGKEDSEDGYTWGQQAATYQRNQFGCSRMDKIFFCGGLELLAFDRFGAGVEVKDESERTRLVELGFDKPWITDHLGVMAHFRVEKQSGQSVRVVGSL